MSEFKLRFEDTVCNFNNMEEAQLFIDKLPTRAGLEIIEAPKLFKELNEIGAPFFNAGAIIQEITIEFSNAKSSEYRAGLLTIFTCVSDLLESSAGGEELNKLREARKGLYKILIVEECLVNGQICVETLNQITLREIAAGRMESDFSLRNIAQEGMAKSHFAREELLRGENQIEQTPHSEQKRTVWARLRGWFTDSNLEF